MSDVKKIVYSGMQPSGPPSLGNYLGALKNWVTLQDEYQCIYSIVDMHCLTVRQDPKELRKRCKDLLMWFIAVGINPEKTVLYYQSQVSAHAELAWILNCYTYLGELNRMTQFKEKSQKHQDNINAGLYIYPVLQAADILLYQTNLVPVGEDQRQHLELSRDIAIRFNNVYGDVFAVPDAHIPKEGARVMGLQEADKKMSKSDTAGDGNVIYLADALSVIKNKIKRAVTDSDNEVRCSPDKPGITNLLHIYSAVTGMSIEEAERTFSGKGYGDFKQAVADAVVDVVEPIQQKFAELSKNKDYIDNIILTNNERASRLAETTLRKVKKKLGLPVI